MNIIYTYKYTDGWDKGLDNPKSVKVFRKSVEMASRWYTPKIICDSNSVDFIKNLDIPNLLIETNDEISKYDSPNWGLMKLISIKNMNIPHIHIDMDTILLKKLDFDNSIDVIWGNAESSLLYGRGHYSSFKYIHDNYLKTAEEFEPNLTNQGFFDFAHVPNNSLLIINNPNLTNNVISDLFLRVNDYYKIHNGRLNMFMEQFLFMNLMKFNNGSVDYMPRKGEFHVSDYYKDKIMNGEIPISDFEENGWMHFEHFNKYTMGEINWILNQIK